MKHIKNTLIHRVELQIDDLTIKFIVDYDEIVGFIRNGLLDKTDSLSNYDLVINANKNTTLFNCYPHIEYNADNGCEVHKACLEWVDKNSVDNKMSEFFLNNVTKDIGPFIENHKRYYTITEDMIKNKYRYWLELPSASDINDFRPDQDDCSFGDYVISCFANNVSNKIFEVIDKLDYETIVNYNILGISIMRKEYDITKALIWKYGLGKDKNGKFRFENDLFNPGSYMLPLLYCRKDYDIIKFFFDHGMTEDYYIHLR